MEIRPTLAIGYIWLLLTTCASVQVQAASSVEETPTGNALLEVLVGSWAIEEHEDNASCIRQDCQWILNRKYLEIQTFVDIKPHPPKTWRTLIAYESKDNSYQLWNFSADGVVTTERGQWNSKSKEIEFKGRTSTGLESMSRLSLLGEDAMQRDVHVYVDADRNVLSGVAFVLGRVSN